MKQREKYRRAFTPQAQEYIAQDKCGMCGLPKTEWTRNTKWRCCSKECTDKFWQEQIVVRSWGLLRNKILERDGYACIKCRGTSGLVADHITPIALGGDEWDMNNIQTLCSECNKKKTRADMRLIGIQRRIEKFKQIPDKQQSLLVALALDNSA